MSGPKPIALIRTEAYGKVNLSLYQLLRRLGAVQ